MERRRERERERKRKIVTMTIGNFLKESCLIDFGVLGFDHWPRILLLIFFFFYNVDFASNS